GLLPQLQVVGVQPDGGAGAVGEGGRGVDVVVVGVGAHDGRQPPLPHRLGDGVGVVGGVDDDRLVVVADDPHVVVDVPGAAVEAELSGGDEPFDAGGHHSTTTERSTSPRCMRSKAFSTSSSPTVSVTNAARSSRPCRCRSISIGKSREGRQSPYQEDFSEPPRPKTSRSGSSSFISGVGTPTRTTVPARSRA